MCTILHDICVCMSIVDKNSTFYVHILLTFKGLLHIQKNCLSSSLQMVESLCYIKRTSDFSILREIFYFIVTIALQCRQDKCYYYYFTDEKKGTERARDFHEVTSLVLEWNLRLCISCLMLLPLVCLIPQL